MGFTCNIDRRGRTIRGGLGILVLSAGTAAWALTSSPRGEFVGVSVAILILSGAFMVFEAIIGWCAIRAMGKKTPF